MRLIRSSLHAYCLPYRKAVHWSDIVEEGASFLMLRLESDTGHCGVSEMTVKPTWTGFGPRSLAESVREVLLPRLARVDLLDDAAVARAFDLVPGQHAGKALLDNALWDLRSAYGGLPLWQAWQGRAEVAVSHTVTRQSAPAMAREAAHAVEHLGVRVLKIKGGQGLSADAEVLRQLRREVGDGIGFYVDANGAYAAGQALDYARRMVDAGARVVEDPCLLTPGAAFRALQGGLGRPVLVDFSCWGLADMRQFREAGARAFSLKPGRLGLTATRAMLREARDHGDLTVTGLFGESAVGTWQALALAACMGEDSLPAEVTWFAAMQQQVVQQVPRIQDGRIHLPSISCVAEMVDWAQVERLALATASETTFP